MSDDNVKLLLEFLLAVAVLATQLLTALLQRRATQVAVAKLEDNTAKTEQIQAQVQTATAGTAHMLRGIKETAQETRDLVNNRHGVALRLAAEALREVADMKQTPESQEAAYQAEQEADRHDAQQTRADESQAREAARQQERDEARARAQESYRPK